MRRNLLIAIGVLIAFFAGAWWYVFYTNAGINFILARLGSLQSVRIVADDVHGHLAGPLTIKHLAIDHKVVHIEIDNIRLELSPSALLFQTIEVDSLTTTRARVDVKPSTDNTPTPPTFFVNFLQLAADRVDIHDARVAVGDTFVQSVDRIQGRLRLNARRLRVDDFAIDATAYSAAGGVTIRAQSPIALQVNTRVNAPAPHGPRLDFTVSLSGPLDKLGVDAALLEPAAAQFRGEIARNNTLWQLRGKLMSDLFTFDPWIDRPPFSLRNLSLDIDASTENIHLAGAVVVPEVDTLPVQLDFDGQYADRIIAITRGDLHATKSDLSIRTAARVDLSGSKPVVAATAQWKQFRWPVRSNYFVSPQGQLSLSGSLPFDIGVNADVQTQYDVGGHVLAHGLFSSAAIEFDDATLDVLGGDIKGAGRPKFSSAHEWRIAVAGRNINPKSISPQLPGSIEFKVDASGVGLDRRADFAITLPMLRGTLRGEPLEGHGYVSHDAGGWSAKELSLTLGANRLAVSGDWRQQINLAWSLEVPALQKFLSEANGSMRFQGTAHGTPQRPQIAGSLSGTKLQYGSWNVEDLLLAGNVDLSNRLASQLEVNATRVGWNDIHMDTLYVRAQGMAASHTVEIRTTTSKNDAFSKVSTKIDGNYANGVWQARIAPLAFADRDGVAPTAQASEGRLLWSDKQRLAENICLLWTKHQFCGGGTWSLNGSWQAKAESDALPLNVFDGAIPQTSGFQGSWQVHAAFAGTPTKPWTGQTTIEVNNASVAYQAIAGAAELVQLGTGRVEVTASADRFLATLRIVTPGTTNIDASAHVERSASVELANSPLAGDLHASTADANLLPLFFPDLDHSAGELTAQLHASGTLASPQFQGQIDLQKGELDLYRYNLSMRHLSVAARIAENHLTFDGQAQLGDGKLALNGDFLWRNLEPVGKLHLEGSNLLVANLPEYRVTASPKVDFQIDGNRVDARGEIAIPSAHIQPKDLRGAVQTSRDVRLVGELPEPPLRGFEVHSEVRVSVGQDVQLDTYGLQGKLGGSVTIVSDGPDAIGRGELNVASGRYEAYGQKLDIARGRLIFDASPLDNPGLDIQAARKIEDSDIRVGVNVRGTLRDPRVSLFSEPPQPQSQIVSMLLTGKPIADLSSQDAATVGAAQNDLRIQGGSLVASQIGRRLGIADVSIESTGLNDTALVLGKFLSPKLFVSYGISLTESINTLKLRYTISSHWFIKGEAGQVQSADVQYRIER